MNFNNNLTREEERQWTAFLNGEPGSSDQIKLDEQEKADLTAVWEEAGTRFSYSAANPDQGWGTIQSLIANTDKSRKVKFQAYRILQYAAILIVVSGIGFGTYQIFRTPKTKIETSVALVVAQTEPHPMKITTVTLSDGSTVKLNANSKLEYPEHFTGKFRQVKLSGEAFFEVTRDASRPFIIVTPTASVEVLGTSFNVSAYPNSDRLEVNVETGKVKLTPITADGLNRKFALLPAGERGWLKGSNGEIGQVARLAPNYAAWITKTINFQHTPLSEVCSVLENTYHVKFKLENAELGNLAYTANFSDLNLDYIVKVIARTHHLRVKKTGDEIILAKSVD